MGQGVQPGFQPALAAGPGRGGAGGLHSPGTGQPVCWRKPQAPTAAGREPGQGRQCEQKVGKVLPGGRKRYHFRTRIWVPATEDVVCSSRELLASEEEASTPEAMTAIRQEPFKGQADARAAKHGAGSWLEPGGWFGSC